MFYNQPLDYQILKDSRCSGSDYAVYLYIKNTLITSAQEAGLSLMEIKRGYDPNDYATLYGISRRDIQNYTGYSLIQVRRVVDKLKELDLAIPDAGDNGRYYYPIHFRLPFIGDKPEAVSQLKLFFKE
jgi:hypothetical protein